MTARFTFRLISIGDFVAELLNEEADRLPALKAQEANAIRHMAYIYENPKMIRVWEET